MYFVHIHEGQGGNKEFTFSEVSHPPAPPVMTVPVSNHPGVGIEAFVRNELAKARIRGKKEEEALIELLMEFFRLGYERKPR